MQFPADSGPVSNLGRQGQDSPPETSGWGTPTFHHPCWVSILTMGRTTGHPTSGRDMVWRQGSWVPPLGNGESFAVSQQPASDNQSLCPSHQRGPGCGAPRLSDAATPALSELLLQSKVPKL